MSKDFRFNVESQEDVFKFHVSPYTGNIPKRNILSYIAKFYDALGYLSPTIFQLKWYLQQLWLKYIGMIYYQMN